MECAARYTLSIIDLYKKQLVVKWCQFKSYNKTKIEEKSVNREHNRQIMIGKKSLMYILYSTPDKFDYSSKLNDPDRSSLDF